MGETQKHYIIGLIIIIICGVVAFYGLNLLPIAYHFRILEVFGLIFLSILFTMSVRPNILN